MNVFRLLISHFTLRGRALSLYRSGMTKANYHDHQGAIEDYSTAIDLPDTPADVRAMAMFNRALVYSAIGEDPRAVADLQSVLEMTDAEAPAVKAEARQKLVRMHLRDTKVHPSNAALELR